MVMIWSHPNETTILIRGCFGYKVHDTFQGNTSCEESSSHVKVPKMYLTLCCFELSKTKMLRVSLKYPMKHEYDSIYNYIIISGVITVSIKI